MTTEHAVSEEAIEVARVAFQDRSLEDHRSTDERMRDALRAASPFLAGDGVKVRPLVWASEPPYRVARVLGGHYAIEVYETGVDLTGSFCVRRGLSSFAEAQAAAQQDYEARIRSALSAPPPQPEVAGLVEAAIAGWNACRSSIYAVCEDVQNNASNVGISLARSETEKAHEKGYYFGQAQAAKSIARGFNSMEAMDDDNLRAALSDDAKQIAALTADASFWKREHGLVVDEMNRRNNALEAELARLKAGTEAGAFKRGDRVEDV